MKNIQECPHTRVRFFSHRDVQHSDRAIPGFTSCSARILTRPIPATRANMHGAWLPG